jgi:hypothetical protein
MSAHGHHIMTEWLSSLETLATLPAKRGQMHRVSTDAWTGWRHTQNVSADDGQPQNLWRLSCCHKTSAVLSLHPRCSCRRGAHPTPPAAGDDCMATLRSVLRHRQ